MPALLKAIVVRPKTDALRHYLGLEAECRNASPLADQFRAEPSVLDSRLPEGSVSAGGAAELNKTLRDIALGKAMQCAEFESVHTGPFNHSGKEISK